MTTSLQQALRQNKKQLASSRDELRQLRNEMNGLEHELPLLLKRVEYMRARLADLPSVITSVEERISGYESEFNRLHAKEIEYSRDHKIASLEREIQRLKRKLGE